MNSEFQRLPLETQEAVKKTMDTMEPAQTPAEIRETLEGTQKGGVKNSIRNCLTVFQRDPLFRGALRLNLLTEQIDIVKPLGWERVNQDPPEGDGFQEITEEEARQMELPF